MTDIHLVNAGRHNACVTQVTKHSGKEASQECARLVANCGVSNDVHIQTRSVSGFWRTLLSP